MNSSLLRGSLISIFCYTRRGLECAEYLKRVLFITIMGIKTMKQLTMLMAAFVMVFGVAGCGESTEPKKVQQMAANSTDQSLENAVKDSADTLKDSTNATTDSKADIETTDKNNADTILEPKEETTIEGKDALEAADKNKENAPIEQPE